jgi:uncharacterized protein YbbK (DUF523 family)
MIIASACLLGVNCRWDGNSSPEKKLLSYLPNVIPVCPEQLGGLTTPRPPAQIFSGNGFDVLDGRAKVVAAGGKDVTGEFIRGAREALNIAGLYQVSGIVLKERSPSCAVHHLHQGRSLVAGMGVTCALFFREGYKVLSVEEIDKLHA